MRRQAALAATSEVKLSAELLGIPRALLASRARERPVAALPATAESRAQEEEEAERAAAAAPPKPWPVRRGPVASLGVAALQAGTLEVPEEQERAEARAGR